MNYIDNETFLASMNLYIKKREEALANNKPKPMIPREIGESIIQIANKLATRYNFHSYTFKDEMISDGILNAIEAVNNFDPEKSKNPFAYFTQVIYWAFVRRIQKEKKEREARDTLMFNNETAIYDSIDREKFDIKRDELFLLMNS